MGNPGIILLKLFTLSLKIGVFMEISLLFQITVAFLNSKLYRLMTVRCTMHTRKWF